MIADEVFTHIQIPLAWLAELDDCPSSNALADAIGDRFLYRHNALFANVRDAALSFGYCFSSEDTPLWRDYHYLSLLSLNQILSSKTIPYCDNGKTLQRLIQQRPALALPPRFITANVMGNHAFHEAAHCVAHSLLRQNEARLNVRMRSEEERFVLEAILAESFANTVEMLGMTLQSSASHTVFYALNSYMPSSKRRKTLLDRARMELGENLRFVLLFLSYFEANLTSAAPTHMTYQVIAEAAGCPTDQTGLAKEVTDVGFLLNVGFRDNTTPVYLGVLGCADAYTALATTAWLSKPGNQIAVRTFIQLLLAVVGQERHASANAAPRVDLK